MQTSMLKDLCTIQNINNYTSIPFSTVEYLLGLQIFSTRLLDSIFDIAGVPPDKFRTICSAVDKLDKESWENVKKEMVIDKGLSEEAADRIGTFVLFKGKPFDLYHKLKNDGIFGEHVDANAALEELNLLFSYLEATDTIQYISFDLSLARGLDYYTGVIYEAVLISGESQVGSIAAGGRYDNLVGMFSASGTQTPCVGVSIGIERVLTILEQQRQKALKEEQEALRRKLEEEKDTEKDNLSTTSMINMVDMHEKKAMTPVEVLIATIGNNMILHRMRVAKVLWGADISCMYLPQDKLTLGKQMTFALDNFIPFMVIMGEEEIAQNVVKVKDMTNREEEVVPIDNVVNALTQRNVKILNNSLYK